jgi:hypothetical protein
MIDSISLLTSLMSEKHEEHVKSKITGLCALLKDSRQDQEVSIRFQNSIISFYLQNEIIIFNFLMKNFISDCYRTVVEKIGKFVET